MLCLPLWEGSGAPTEIVTKLTADSISALDWITTEYGPAVNSDSNARITWTSFPTGSFGESQGTTDPEVSIVFLVRIRSAGNSHVPISWTSNAPTGEPDGLWAVGTNTTGLDDWQIRWDDAGIANTELSTVAAADDTVWGLVAITREQGGVFRFYQEGLEVASSTDTTAWNAVATNLQLTLFKDDANAVKTFGSIAFAAAWNRVLSAAEIALLSDDVYGFIRPAVIELEAAGGTAHTATPTEAVGVADVTSRVHDAKRTPTETVGVTDATPVKQGKEVAEAVGVADATAVKRGLVVTEPVGVTDTVAAAKTITVEITEAVGVTDTTTRVHSKKRIVTEPVGLTDATPVKQSKVVTEPVGVTDATPVKLVIAQEITEPVGVTDQTPIKQSKVLTEPVGVTDATPTKQGKVVVEAVGVTDSTVDDLTTPGLEEVLTEAVGVLDSLDLKQGKETAEPVGVTDSIVPAKTIRVTITEAIGVTDSTLAARSIVRVEDQYLTLPGISGHNASTPTHPSLNLSDNFFAGIYAEPDNWSNLQSMLAKWLASGDKRSWMLRTTAAGAIQVRASDDGSTNEGVTGPVLGFVGGHWFGFDFVAGFVRYYDGGTDPDNPVWVEIGSGDQLATITSINLSDADVEIGTINNGASDPLSGKVVRAVIYNDIARTGLVADFNAGDFNAGDTDTDTAVGSAGKTWTLNGATPKIGPIVGVTDETTTIVAAVRVVAELVGVADVVAPARMIVREITESVGVTDTTIEVGPAAIVVTIIEAIGVTDTIDVEQAPWWTKDPTGHTKNPTSHTKDPTGSTKIKAGDTSPW